MGRPRPKTKTDRTRALGYVRVSLEKQAADGVSLDAQRARIEAYAKLYEVDLIDVTVETGSGKSLDRPALQRTLVRLAAGDADALIVARLDRLTRSVTDLGALVADAFGPRGAALLSVTEQVDTRTASGRLVLNVIASISQWERESTAERTRAAMAHLRAQGRHTGGDAPFGYRVDRQRLVQVPQEQAAIARARELRADHTLAATAEQLALEGHRARNGRAFTEVQVWRITRAEEVDNTNAA